MSVRTLEVVKTDIWDEIRESGAALDARHIPDAWFPTMTENQIAALYSGDAGSDWS